MAEIGLVASIFGVAAYGTKVVTTLYETGDVLIHAHQQIASMAKHVSQFTAVLRHLGRVLEAERGNCSKDLLRDVRKIISSCKGTFKEIKSTLRSKRFRPLIPVRWLFKRSKAKELEARLDSEQSMLQTMIQSVTVSKLGDMQARYAASLLCSVRAARNDTHTRRSKDDSIQLSALREEIALLKTLIIENYNNVAELQRAEQSAEAEADVWRPSSPAEAMYQGYFDTPYTPGDPINPPPYPGLSESDEESGDPDEATSNTQSTQSRHQDENGNDGYSVDTTQTPSDYHGNIVPQVATCVSSLEPEMQRASALLLQMVPYRPPVSNSSQAKQSDRLLRAPGLSDTVETKPKPAMEEATKSVRLLLDKWTTSGSAPVSDFLVEDE